jgi:hypothetical protein
MLVLAASLGCSTLEYITRPFEPEGIPAAPGCEWQISYPSCAWYEEVCEVDGRRWIARRHRIPEKDRSRSYFCQ